MKTKSMCREREIIYIYMYTFTRIGMYVYLFYLGICKNRMQRKLWGPWLRVFNSVLSLVSLKNEAKLLSNIPVASAFHDSPSVHHNITISCSVPTGGLALGLGNISASTAVLCSAFLGTQAVASIARCKWRAIASHEYSLMTVPSRRPHFAHQCYFTCVQAYSIASSCHDAAAS